MCEVIKLTAHLAFLEQCEKEKKEKNEKRNGQKWKPTHMIKFEFKRCERLND